MKKPFSLSPSSIKCFVGSKAKRGGRYLLNIQDSDDNQDNLRIGKLFEERLFTGKDNWDMMNGVEIANADKIQNDYDTLKHNSKGMPFIKGETQVFVEGELFGYPIKGYIDNLVDGVIEDIKTAHYLSKPGDDSVKNFRSGMSYNQEYELQLYIYMKLLGKNKARILEVSKHKYKDERKAHQIIEYNLTPEFNDRMEKRLKPIVEQMAELYNKFNLT